LNSKKIKV